MSKIFKVIVLALATLTLPVQSYAKVDQLNVASVASIFAKNALIHIALASDNADQATNFLRAAHIAGIAEGLIAFFKIHPLIQTGNSISAEENCHVTAATSIIMNHIIGLYAHWKKAPRSKNPEKLQSLLYTISSVNIAVAFLQLLDFDPQSTMGCSEMQTLSHNFAACVDAFHQLLINDKDHQALATLNSALVTINAGCCAYEAYKIAKTLLPQPAPNPGPVFGPAPIPAPQPARQAPAPIQTLRPSAPTQRHNPRDLARNVRAAALARQAAARVRPAGNGSAAP